MGEFSLKEILLIIGCTVCFFGLSINHLTLLVIYRPLDGE